MNAAPQAACSRCRKPVDPEDRHCRHCGRKIPRPGETPWAYTPLGIIILTLTIMGPLTIGLVWRSPALSRPAKWGFTAAIAVLSVALLWAFYIILMFGIHQWTELNRELDGWGM